jgi:hypothetical protein
MVIRRAVSAAARTAIGTTGIRGMACGGAGLNGELSSELELLGRARREKNPFW